MTAEPARDEPVPLFGGGDRRCETLFEALLDVMRERGKGLSVPAVLGVLRLLEHHIVMSHVEEEG